MKTASFLFILVLCFSLPVYGQEGKINTALKQYEIGRFAEVLALLEPDIDRFSSEEKADALRLCAIASMAMDDREKTVHYAKLLLNESADYNNNSDPPRFKDLIANLKGELTATITTASSSSETLAETPVPVVLITEEMIKDCGAQTLQDALIAYVPGITVMEINGVMSFAMRGISGSSQEKVLIMLNGIRLNSYCSNLGLADYSVSLKKIKQIEVLRGPASSLYGDAALTAVVNVITKSGSDINGLDISVEAGNFGQVRADAVLGKHYAGFDITAWAGFYRSDGEYVDVSEDDVAVIPPSSGSIIVGGFNNRPSFDFGTKLNYKGLFVEYACNSSKTVIPFTKADEQYYREPYSYSKYCNIDGNQPGAAFETHHVKTGYTKKFGNLTLELSWNMTYETMSKYFVISDNTDPYYYLESYGWDENDSLKRTIQWNGIAVYDGWVDFNQGVSIQAAYNYGHSDNGGTIMSGADASVFKYLTNRDSWVYDFNRRDSYIIFFRKEKDEFQFLDKEPKNEFFVQWKHRYQSFLINSGIKYYYRRHAGFYNVKYPDDVLEEKKVKEFSPRISLIYMPNSKLDFKFAYSKAFVDIPFHYRTDDLEGELQPEKLHSFQFAVHSQKKYKKNTFNVEMNFFYNKCKGLSLHNLKTKWDVSIAGIEPIVSYNGDKWNVYGSFSFQKVTDFKSGQFKTIKVSKIYDEDSWYFEEDTIDALYDEVIKGGISNVPSFSANLTAGYRLTKKLKLCSNFYYTGQQYCKINGETEKIPQVFFVNPELRYSADKFELKLDVHNVFNHSYSLGERNSLGTIRQKGRWIMAGVSFKF